MDEKTPEQRLTYFIFTAYYVIYALCTIIQSDWGSILSPVGSFMSFIILVRIVVKTKNYPRIMLTWGMLALSCLSWTIADILLAWDIFVLHTDPNTDTLAQLFYAGTNFFIAVASFIFILRRFRKWNAMQLFVDSITITFSVLFLFWVLFFDRHYDSMALINMLGYSGFACLILDILLLTGLAIWFISIRDGFIPKFNRILAASILLFIITDSIYYYIYLKDLYHINTFIDSLYILSLLGIAVSSAISFKTNDYSVSANTNFSYHARYKHKGILIFIVPGLVILLNGVDLISLFIFTLIVLLHNVLSNYIQGSIRDQQLLVQERELNQQLEKRIAARTQELLEKAQELERKNLQLFYLSSQDIVTKLYNRRYFLDILQDKITHNTNENVLALLFLDVDRFKTINDVYGHMMGDKLIIALSKRLQKYVGSENEMLARFGGDEFVIALNGSYSAEDISSMTQEIITNCTEPIHLGNYTFRITISVGVSIYPRDALSLDAMIKNSDIAMYQAKKQGFNQFVIYNDEINNAIKWAHNIEILLQGADYDNEFQLYYQPQFNIRDKTLVGFEALLRWNSPKGGRISPKDFIPIAEETDLIIPLGSWVMDKAINQIVYWNSRYQSNYKVGINVSIKQLNHSNFFDTLKTSLSHYAVPPEWIDLEITESVAMEEHNKVFDITRLMKASGMSISIDDFGTGFSSLSYLKIFPLDRIKIAKPLVDNITNDEFSKQIVSSIIMMARSINIITIAEGVETEEQFELLKELGCDQIQGYYLGRPMPASEFEIAFLQAVVA